ncbi:hypothetical protein L7F22_065089 [Adiantum nelumboides]|nr:hypothetical protein [Adiantum nelumboides]
MVTEIVDLTESEERSESCVADCAKLVVREGGDVQSNVYNMGSPAVRSQKAAELPVFYNRELHRSTEVAEGIGERPKGYSYPPRSTPRGDDKVASFFETVPIRKSKFEPQDYSDAKKSSKFEQKVASTESMPPTESVSVTKEDTKQQQQQLTTKKAVKFAGEKNPATSSQAADCKEQEVKTPVTDREEKRNKKEKTATPIKEEKKADTEMSVSVLDIRVGLIVKVWKHPSADALFVEEIDLGESNVRQVVSGLARYLKEDDLLDRKVVLIANVKPGKLRDVVSAGLVLCASNSNHSSVEPLIVPDGAAVGEKITFAGHEGKPEDVLNPKKKQLEKIFPDLCTDDHGVATYKGIPFMTSAGPCKSTLSKALIK